MEIPFNEKYEYLDKDYIAKGGFSEIYKIRDKKVKTEYILKKIRKKEENVDGTDQETFENELNFLKSIKGKNILKIIDYYSNKNDKYYYLILEKMDGDLNMLLKKKYKNGMTSKLIRKIFSQINSGLKILIENGKTHRDLKPSNILYSYINDKKTDFIIKIGDFGFSADLIDSKTEQDLGTSLFKAPEVKTEKYSNKCDLYSIGIILYMLKTGEYIFEGKDKEEKLENKKLNKIKKDTDDEKLNNLIKKLVVIDPDKRMKWDDYFEDPFFNENDEDVQENNGSKINNFNIKVK